MGALQDRLIVTIQDARAWLKLPLTYANVTVAVVVDPLTGSVPANTIFYAIVNGQRAEFDSGATPTSASVAAGLVAAITGLAIAGLTATDLGGGRFSISAATGTFELYLSDLQVIEPTIPDDAILLALIQTAVILADDYLGNDFADVDTNTGEIVAGTEQAIPLPVKTGVLQLVAWLMAEQRKLATNAGTIAAAPVGGVKSKKAGDLQVTYATGADSESESSKAAAAVVGLPILVTSLLDAYRLMPGSRKKRAARPRRFGLGDMGPDSAVLPDTIPGSEIEF